MINFDSVKNIFVIADGNRCSRGIATASAILEHSKPSPEKKSVCILPTNKYTVEENYSDHELMERLRPLVGEIEKSYDRAVKKELNNDANEGVLTERKIDPKLLFLIDTSNKTAAALAHLFQGPWGGYPFAKHTLAIDLSAETDK